jgi:hypothetical protein
MSWRLGTGGWRLGDRGWIGISVAAVVLLTAGTVSAQTSGERYEVGGGVRFVGPEALGRVDANETNAGGGAFRLFTADSTLHALVTSKRFGVWRCPRFDWKRRIVRRVRSQREAQLTWKAPRCHCLERIRQFTLEGGPMEPPAGALRSWRRFVRRHDVRTARGPHSPDTGASGSGRWVNLPTLKLAWRPCRGVRLQRASSTMVSTPAPRSARRSS